ncbi:MAG: DinB family protein [Sphingobacteriales bacterium]|nr:MAG: DinB family protein [Sphingobacteriales bacterium]
MAQLQLDRIPSYYHRYVAQVQQLDLGAALAERRNAVLPLLRSLPADRWEYAYAPGKWTIKELVLHLADTERVFAYRALTFARNGNTPLPGFDENTFAEYSEANRRTPESLLAEFESVLDSTDALFFSFSDEQLERSGLANEKPVYVYGIAYILAGHILHHRSVMLERYLEQATVS